MNYTLKKIKSGKQKLYSFEELSEINKYLIDNYKELNDEELVRNLFSYIEQMMNNPYNYIDKDQEYEFAKVLSSILLKLKVFTNENQIDNIVQIIIQKVEENQSNILLNLLITYQLIQYDKDYLIYFSKYSRQFLSLYIKQLQIEHDKESNQQLQQHNQDEFMKNDIVSIYKINTKLQNDNHKTIKRNRSYDFIQSAFSVENDQMENQTKILSTFSKYGYYNDLLYKNNNEYDISVRNESSRFESNRHYTIGKNNVLLPLLTLPITSDRENSALQLLLSYMDIINEGKSITEPFQLFSLLDTRYSNINELITYHNLKQQETENKLNIPDIDVYEDKDNATEITRGITQIHSGRISAYLTQNISLLDDDIHNMSLYKRICLQLLNISVQLLRTDTEIQCNDLLQEISYLLCKRSQNIILRDAIVYNVNRWYISDVDRAIDKLSHNLFYNYTRTGNEILNDSILNVKLISILYAESYLIKLACINMTHIQLSYNFVLKSIQSYVNILPSKDRYKVMKGRIYDLMAHSIQQTEEFKRRRTQSIKKVIESLAKQLEYLLREDKHNTQQCILELKNLIKNTKSIILIKELFLCQPDIMLSLKWIIFRVYEDSFHNNTDGNIIRIYMSTRVQDSYILCPLFIKTLYEYISLLSYILEIMECDDDGVIDYLIKIYVMDIEWNNLLKNIFFMSIDINFIDTSQLFYRYEYDDDQHLKYNSNQYNIGNVSSYYIKYSFKYLHYISSMLKLLNKVSYYYNADELTAKNKNQSLIIKGIKAIYNYTTEDEYYYNDNNKINIDYAFETNIQNKIKNIKKQFQTVQELVEDVLDGNQSPFKFLMGIFVKENLSVAQVKESLDGIYLKKYYPDDDIDINEFLQKDNNIKYNEIKDDIIIENEQIEDIIDKNDDYNDKINVPKNSIIDSSISSSLIVESKESNIKDISLNDSGKKSHVSRMRENVLYHRSNNELSFECSPNAKDNDTLDLQELTTVEDNMKTSGDNMRASDITEVRTLLNTLEQKKSYSLRIENDTNYMDIMEEVQNEYDNIALEENKVVELKDVFDMNRCSVDVVVLYLTPTLTIIGDNTCKSIIKGVKGLIKDKAFLLKNIHFSKSDTGLVFDNRSILRTSNMHEDKIKIILDNHKTQMSNSNMANDDTSNIKSQNDMSSQINDQEKISIDQRRISPTLKQYSRVSPETIDFNRISPPEYRRTSPQTRDYNRIYPLIQTSNYDKYSPTEYRRTSPETRDYSRISPIEYRRTSPETRDYSRISPTEYRRTSPETREYIKVSPPAQEIRISPKSDFLTTLSPKDHMNLHRISPIIEYTDTNKQQNKPTKIISPDKDNIFYSQNYNFTRNYAQSENTDRIMRMSPKEYDISHKYPVRQSPRKAYYLDNKPTYGVFETIQEMRNSPYKKQTSPTQESQSIQSAYQEWKNRTQNK